MNRTIRYCRPTSDYVDCFRIVISKFRTIDLYIPHTTNAYSAAAAQPKMNTSSRPSAVSPLWNVSGATSVGFTSTAISVNGLKHPTINPGAPMLEPAALIPHTHKPPQTPATIPTLLI